jgi:iron complex outermembrane receptor protein
LALAALAGFAHSGLAQTLLPGIVVETPSPISNPRVERAPTPAGESGPAPKAQPKAAPPAAAKQVTQAPPPAAAVVTSPLVTAPPRGTLIVVDDQFVPVTVVPQVDFQAQPGQTLTATLQNRPGIAGTTFAPGASRPVIRGLDTFRVRTQENGIGTHDVAAISEDHAVPVDPNSIEQVEIVRGPATLRYGSQAIGGVVDARNGRIPDAIPLNGMSLRIQGGLNSVDRGREQAFAVTQGIGQFAVHADGFARRSDDYGTPLGRQANSFVESEGWSIGGSYIWSSGFVGAAFTRFQSLYGIPGVEAAYGRTRIDLTQDKVTSKGEFRVRDYGIEAIRFWLGSTNYRHNELGFEAGVGNFIGTRLTNREHEGRVEIQHQPVRTVFGELRGAIGLQAGRRDLAGYPVAEPVDGLIDPALTRSLAVFLFEELQVTQRLRLQAAARIERNSVSGRGLDLSDPLLPTLVDRAREFKPGSFSAGVLYDLPLGAVARLTGQVTERAPDAAELFSKGPHEATGTFEIGNIALGKERAQTIEFGLKRAKGDLRFDASVFSTRFDGFIYKQLTGRQCDGTIATCGAGSELNELVFSQRDATFQGVELSAQLDVAQIFRGTFGLEGQFDSVRARFSNGESVPRIPPHRIGGGLFYRDPSWYLRAGALHAFEQTRVGAAETATGGWTNVYADVAYVLQGPGMGKLTPEVLIGVRGENLLDDDIRNHVSFKKDEVLEPGRTVKLYGTIRLN